MSGKDIATVGVLVGVTLALPEMSIGEVLLRLLGRLIRAYHYARMVTS